MSKITLNPESLQEWIADNAEQKRYDYDIPSGTVIDCGSCKGDWYIPAVRKWPGAQFILFEPTDYMNQIPVRSGDIFVKAAAWKFHGDIELGGDFFATGLYEDNPKIYPCVDIAQFITKDVELVKINIEGCEYQLIEHLIDTGCIAFIKNLQVQFHEIDGQPYQQWYEDIAARLKETHVCNWRYSYVWENWVRK